MKGKALFLTVAFVLSCVSVMADDIYYSVDRKSKKSQPEIVIQNSDNTLQSPEEFQKKLSEFRDNSLKYYLSQLSKKTVIGKLICKKWCEFNPQTMSINGNYYTEFTFTHRIIVGIDQSGNISERFQKFYLSNKYETKFDSTKVGKTDNGKYIVVQSVNNPTQAVSMLINNISNDNLDYTEVVGGKDLKKFFVAESDDLSITQDELSPSEKLLNKTWACIDEKTGEPTRYEYRYEPYGYMEKCVLGENRCTDFPYWIIGEYYFSDEVDSSFDYSKKDKKDQGRYIVNHIKENGVVNIMTYEIKSLCADTMLLECVYPANGENIKLASTTKQTPDTTSMLDKLVGKQWRIQRDRYDRYDNRKRSYSGAIYFTETQFVGPWRKTIDNRIIGKDEFIYNDFYLSDHFSVTFSHEDAAKKQKNGKYIVISHNGSISATSKEILYLTENMLVVRGIYNTYTTTYICD